MEKREKGETDGLYSVVLPGSGVHLFPTRAKHACPVGGDWSRLLQETGLKQLSPQCILYNRIHLYDGIGRAHTR